MPINSGGAILAAPPRAGCASTGTSRSRLDELVERGHADQRRCDQHGAGAGIARDARLQCEGARRTDQARRVEARATAVARRTLDRALARMHALGERRVRLVGEAVIVLHHVDAVRGELVAQRCERCTRQSLAA